MLSDVSTNGIPRHLLARHADIIAKHGAGAASLQHKAFPKSAEISKYNIEHEHGAKVFHHRVPA